MKKIAFLQNRQTRAVHVMWLILLVTMLMGCGGSNLFEGIADDNSKEARTEEALMAMDDGDYASAITLLQDLVASYPGDAQLIQYLSSAYSGLAGLDTLNLLEIIDQLDESGNSGSIDMIGLVLGDANAELSGAEVDAKLTNIDLAIATLAGISAPNDDQTILLGLLSATHLALTMADIVMQDLDDDAIVLTEEGLGALYNGSADFADMDPAISAETLAALEDDIANMGNAVDELNAISDEGNDLAQDFAEFQNAIDLSGDGDITATDLANYINTL